MDPRKLFVDKRLTGCCAHCGGEPTTRDHVPPKVFLDEPYPFDLPLVPACEKCNGEASSDEQYVACAIECAISGSTESEKVSRSKIRETLAKRPALAARLAASAKTSPAGVLLWEIDVPRFKNVILKLARDHASFEENEQPWVVPSHIAFSPLVYLTADERERFESIEQQSSCFLPELGSRAFLRAINDPESFLKNDWLIVQPARYRYRIRRVGRFTIQMVLSEYLACEVAWD